MCDIGSTCKLANFDADLLNIYVRGYIVVYVRSKKAMYQTDLETAKTLVLGKVARVTNEFTIERLYSTNEFNEIIKQRSGHKCYYCDGKGTTIDHVVPRSRGGLRTFDNCVCACSSCNVRKGNKLLSELPPAFFEVKRQKKKRRRKRRRSKI